jgi:hypothetical protein
MWKVPAPHFIPERLKRASGLGLKESWTHPLRSLGVSHNPYTRWFVTDTLHLFQLTPLYVRIQACQGHKKKN